jgi:hypothetical protein
MKIIYIILYMLSTPTLVWSQTDEKISMSIQLPNITDELVSYDNNVFLFSCLSSSKKYMIEFELYKSVLSSSFTKSDKKIEINLQKEEFEKWDFLTKIKGIYKNNIKIDWDKWTDSDSENEQNENLGMDQGMNSGMDPRMMQEMMANMSGGGNDDFYGGEGDEEGDEEEGDEGDEEGEEGEEGGDEGGDEGGEEGEEEVK